MSLHVSHVFFEYPVTKSRDVSDVSFSAVWLAYLFMAEPLLVAVLFAHRVSRLECQEL